MGCLDTDLLPGATGLLGPHEVAWMMERSPEATILTDPNGVIEYVNPAFVAMSGYARDEAIGRRPSILKSDRQPREFYERLWQTLRAGREFRDVLVNRRKCGGTFHEEKTIRPLFDERGRICHFLSVGHDVSERVASIERLTRAATHDPLTGLPNRALFVDRLEQALAQARRSGEAFAVAVLDLDGFKAVNDTLGHAAGDALLAAVAQRLRASVRASDTVARLGGDEFGILLPATGDVRAVSRALEKLLQGVAQPLVVEGARIPVAASIGASRWSGEGDDAATVLRRADTAMYRVKRAGGKGWQLEGEARRNAAPMLPPARPGDIVVPGSDLAWQWLCEAAPGLQRIVHEGDPIYRAGQDFASLHLLRVGSAKLVRGSADGRVRIVGLHFKGDWLGLDGIADGRHECDAVAMDTSEVWSVRYDAILRAGQSRPGLLAWLHATMSRGLLRGQEAFATQHGLPADARVADFLLRWAETLQQRGLRADQILLRLSRAEIGNFLGVRLETVSRAMSRLAAQQLIRFGTGRGRELTIPDTVALAAFVRRAAAA